MKSVQRRTDSDARRRRAFGAAALILVGLGAPVQARVVEKIAALVGDEIVLQSEVEERAATAMAELGAIADQGQRAQRAAALRREILERIIDEHLLVQQAMELKLNVSSEEVDRTIEAVKANNGNMTDADLLKALAQQGMTMGQYRASMKRELYKQKVTQIAVGSKISITDADVQSYYERNLKSGTNVQVKASHVFVAIPEGADAAVVRDKEAFARQIAERARKGEDFAKLAKELSEDRHTRGEGGDLGYFGKDLGLPKPVEELVFNMKVGEIGGPVRASQGFHVLKLFDRRAKDVKPLAEMKNDLRRDLYYKEFERQTKHFLGELRKKTLVEVRL
jgi:peptidyl-prolyl cis-trans isomerase SurA